MATEERSGSRGAIATVVATAAVTLAIGVTAAGLGGSLVPVWGASRAESVPPAEPSPTEARAGASMSAPAVVLVPVAPDGAGGPPATGLAPPSREMLVATYEPSEHRENRLRSRKHHDRKHEADHDDDDD